MWTPRRVLLLVMGAGLFVAAFLVYNRFLGWIDGLPALPERYLVRAKPDSQPVEEPREDRLGLMLRQSFGDNCPEAGYRYKLRQSQGLLLAFQNLDIDDGRVKLWPFSLAVIGKINPRTGYKEINTVHCDAARITFDHRIETLSDISRSKILAADFFADRNLPINDRRKGYIFVVHNHATPQAADDLIVRTPGPVHFEDSAARTPDKPQLWTTSGIDAIDYQTDPPQRVTAQTFSLYLQPDSLKPGARTGGTDRPSALKRVELGQVQMFLTIDRPSDFLSSAATATSARPAERSKLSVRTQGAFRYDVPANRAEFVAGVGANDLPQYVEVVRDQPQGADELRCDHLELQFRHKAASADPRPRPVPEPPNANGALEIEEVRATGSNVVLISVMERLHARGTELVFRQDRREAVLRGTPMSAVKEGNRIEAPLLLLHRPDPSLPQPASVVTLGRAPGPGTIYLHDAREQRNVEVRWADELLMEREGERDRLTLSGRAVFEDRENAQRLQGDQIRIWMQRPARTAKAPPAPGERVRPDKMQVTGHVEASSPDLVIDDTPALVVWFQDVERTIVAKTPASLTAAPPAPARPRLGPPEAPGAVAPAPSPARRPIRLSADIIETVVRRNGEKVDLDRVTCRKRVHARQDPDSPAERGLDIRCRELNLTHSNDGDVLRLNGTAADLARVQIHELTMQGPQILFDQRDNRVDVDGAGLATIQTSSNLNGDKLEQPTEVTIHWNSRMDFVGNRVSFHGGVQAEQESTRIKDRVPEREVNRLLCPKMDVYLDRAVSFSEMHRAQTAAARGGRDEKPRVKRVVCHRGAEGDPAGLVSISGNLWRDGKRVRYQQIDAPEVTFENDTGEVRADCSERSFGELRLFQLGDKTPLGLTDKAEKPAPNEQVFKLTRVRFRNQLRANNRLQSIAFGGQVEVWHGPADDPQLRIDPDHLPSGALTLACRTLEVVVRGEAGHRYTEMVATGKANIYAVDFSGQADVIKYDESKQQQVILDSRGGNPAALYHFKEKGQPAMRVLAKTIYYWRETNTFRISAAVDVTGSQ